MHKRYILIALAAGVILAAVFLLHRSEEDRILGQIEELRELAEIQTREGSVELLVKSRLLGEFFTENTFYDMTGNGQRLSNKRDCRPCPGVHSPARSAGTDGTMRRGRR